MKYLKLFEELNHVNLNISKDNSYFDLIELVPVEELDKFKEFDRNIIENPFSIGIEKLSELIIAEGLKSPLIIDYSVSDKAVLIIEGNNRLGVAKKLNLKYLPARVIRRNLNFSKTELKKSMKVKGVEPDRYGYVKGNLKPSEIGIEGCKPIITGKESLY